MKKCCPFRKLTTYSDMYFSAGGQAIFPQTSREEFLPCLEKNCAAYFESDLVAKCTLCDNTLEAKYHGSCE